MASKRKEGSFTTVYSEGKTKEKRQEEGQEECKRHFKETSEESTEDLAAKIKTVGTNAEKANTTARKAGENRQKPRKIERAHVHSWTIEESVHYIINTYLHMYSCLAQVLAQGTWQ